MKKTVIALACFALPRVIRHRHRKTTARASPPTRYLIPNCATLANMIVKVSGQGLRLSFAESIREFVASLTGLRVWDLTNGSVKEEALPEFGGKPPRQ